MCNRTMEQGTENMIYPSAVNDFLDGSFGCHENSDRLSPASSPASTIDGDSSGSQYGVDLSGKSESCSSLGKSFTIAAILGLTAKRDDHLLNMSVQERLNRQGRMSGHYFYAQDDRLCFNGFEDQGAQDQMRSGNVTSKHSRLLPNTCANKSSRSKRIRTIFTPEQLERLEAEFERQQYMVGPERLYLAHALQLTEAQVKVWFQNRRIKWRKHHLELTHQRLAALQRHRQNQEDDLEHHT